MQSITTLLMRQTAEDQYVSAFVSPVYPRVNFSALLPVLVSRCVIVGNCRFLMRRVRTPSLAGLLCRTSKKDPSVAFVWLPLLE